MKNHAFIPEDDATIQMRDKLPCMGCGKMLWHEEHFGGDRAKANAAFQMVKSEGRAMRPPPKFATIAEADAWLEANATDGRTVEEPLRFATQEEADDWMRRQAGEPYVPDSWEMDRVRATRDMLYNEGAFVGGMVAPASGPVHGSTSLQPEDMLRAIGMAGVMRSEPVQRVKAEAIADKLFDQVRSLAASQLLAQEQQILMGMGMQTPQQLLDEMGPTTL